MSEELRNFYEVVAIDLTYQCNFRCRHCFNYSGEHHLCQTELTWNELFPILEDIAIISPITVCLCGGEPLLRKEIIFKTTNYLKEKILRM